MGHRTVAFRLYIALLPMCRCCNHLLGMHPELLNNSLFLRYYNQWLKAPNSVVFASVADFFLMYGKIDEAMQVCREGLKHSPDCVSGRLVLTKTHLMRGNLDEADEELRRVLDIVPSHTKALELRTEIELAKRGEARTPVMKSTIDEMSALATAMSQDQQTTTDDDTAELLPTWQTITMAKIYSSQGHQDKAREIYRAILSRDPTNEAAQSGLDALGGGT